MNFPPDLPYLIEYRVGNTVRTALPRRAVMHVSSSGVTDAAVVCPQIPYGCDGWRRPGGAWHPLSALPPAWLPYLNRARPSELDPRPSLRARPAPRRNTPEMFQAPLEAVEA